MTVTDTQHRKYLEYMRERGTPVRMSPAEAEPVRDHITALHSAGMSYNQISARSGVCAGALTRMIRETGGVLRHNAAAILAVQYQPNNSDTGPRVTPGQLAGAGRRLRALWVAGYPETHLCRALGYTSSNVRFLLHDTAIRMHRRPYDSVVELYEKLKFVDPQDWGVPAASSKKATTAARKYSAAPEHCWDETTIDDADAFPEWTGACGTVHGRTVHMRESILPICQPCKDASAGRRKALWSGEVREDELDREKLGRLLEKDERTLKDIAAEASLHRDSLSGWKNGTRNPTDKSLARLAEVLGVHTQELMK